MYSSHQRAVFRVSVRILLIFLDISMHHKSRQIAAIKGKSFFLTREFFLSGQGEKIFS